MLVCVWCIHVCRYRSLRKMSVLCLIDLHFIPWRQGLSVTLEVASKPHWSSCPMPQHWIYRDLSDHIWIFRWCWDQNSDSYVHREPLLPTVISVQPFYFSGFSTHISLTKQHHEYGIPFFFFFHVRKHVGNKSFTLFFPPPFYTGINPRMSHMLGKYTTAPKCHFGDQLYICGWTS